MAIIDDTKPLKKRSGASTSTPSAELLSAIAALKSQIEALESERDLRAKDRETLQGLRAELEAAKADLADLKKPVTAAEASDAKADRPSWHPWVPWKS